MRYLILLALFFSAYSLAADAPPNPTCANYSTWSCNGNASDAGVTNQCLQNSATKGFLQTRAGCSWLGPAAHEFRCGSNCTCPAGFTYAQGSDINGNKTSGCVPDDSNSNGQCSGQGEVKNLDTGMCEPKTECAYPQLYDSYFNACNPNPLNCAIGAKANPLAPGTCMATGETSCPPSGWVLSQDALNCIATPSSSGNNSSVNNNASSHGTASSTQTNTSSPDNSSSGNGNGNGNGNGGDSGSGSASSSGNTGGGGSNSSWTPNSAYGNWIPVDANSNCPNKYQDDTGKWWCWGGQSSTGSSAGGGSNSSGAGLGGEDCESEPQCTMDTMDCAQLIQQWHTRCGGEKLDEKFWELPDQGDDKVTFEKSLKKFKEKLEKLPNTKAITEFFKFNGSGSCPVWAVNVWVFDIVIDQQCSPNIPWGLIRGIIIAVAALVAARIALT